MDLIASFISLSLDNSATQGLQPVNQKFKTVTALLENRVPSTLFPSKSVPERSLNGVSSSAASSVSAEPVVASSSSSLEICSSIPRMVSMSLSNVLSSSSVKEDLFSSMVAVRKSA